MDINQAKEKLDNLINRSRFRCYRPIRLAEILYHSRTKEDINIENPDEYRVSSGRWRDIISERVLGIRTKSSRSFQRDFFNLMPQSAIVELDKINKKNPGIVENYIYQKLRKDKWNGIISARDYIQNIAPSKFSLSYLMNFGKNSGLEEGILYEIAVYALFSAIVDELGIEAKLELKTPHSELIKDFKDFTRIFLGIEPGITSYTTPVTLYRAGQGTYAADKGIDIGTNFGKMVQVKYVTLSQERISSIENTTSVNQLVVVCKDADRDIIYQVSRQLGYNRVKDIVTFSDLKEWYQLALDKYEQVIGNVLLEYLIKEFEKEFTIPKIDDLIEERKYNLKQLNRFWTI